MTNSRPLPRFRDSACMVITRDNRQVLMGRRGLQMRVLPGYYAFPGGVLETQDWTVTPASPLTPAVHERLARHGGHNRAVALAAAAVRETHEEIGLSLGAPDAPNLSALDYFARALTPSNMPARFDTRFFSADASQFKGRLRGNGELSHLRFYDIDEIRLMIVAPITRLLVDLLEQRFRGEGLGQTRSFSSRHSRWVVDTF